MLVSVNKVLWSLSLIGLIVLSGCQGSLGDRPNILVIAVDSLKFDDVRCLGSSAEKSAFSTMCAEAVRFTHAYSPSSMSQPSLVSLLTGQYPFETGVWDNGKSFLKEEFVTTAEGAFAKGYSTGFVSGGAPIWSKSGLQQGFSRFQDGLKVGSLYTPAPVVVRRLKKMITSSKKPFFVVGFFADLQFPDKETFDTGGQTRELSVNGQIQTVDEQLDQLFSWMKARRIWDNTSVFFVGTRGRADSARKGLSTAASIFADATHIAAFVKPKRKPRDLGISWNVDAPISLVDLGRTLQDILSLSESISPHATSLTQEIREPNSRLHEKRFVYIESGWPTWHGLGNSLFGARRGHLFYVHDQKSSLYNSLVDREEENRISAMDPEAKDMVETANRFWLELGISPFQSLQPTVLAKLELAKSVFLSSPLSKTDKRVFRALMRKRIRDRQLIDWLAYFSLRDQDWRTLEQLGKRANEPDWIYVARLNQEKEPSVSPNLCLMKKEYQDCFDQDSRYLKVWMNQGYPLARRERAREKFIRDRKQLFFRRDVESRNYVNGLTWFKPSESLLKPMMSDLLLALPENRSKRKQVRNRIARAN